MQNDNNIPTSEIQKEFLLKLVKTKMPFGKYKDHLLIDLPEYYLTWFRQKGFPKGNLGIQMQTVYEMKANGLDDVLQKLKRITD